MQPRRVLRHTRKPTRIMIVRMWLSGVPAREIARKFGKSSTTVYKWIRRFRQEGSVDTWRRRTGTKSTRDLDGDSTTMVSSSESSDFGGGSGTDSRTNLGCRDLSIFPRQQNETTGLSPLQHRRFTPDVKTASDIRDYVLACYNQQLWPYYSNYGHEVLDSCEGTTLSLLRRWPTTPRDPGTNFMMDISSCALCMGRKDYGFMSPLSHVP